MGVDRIVRFLSDNRFTVLFSGGKDSAATLLWILDNVNHKNWDVLYVEVTGNTHPYCTKYVYDLIGELGIDDKLVHVKTEDFFELMEKWGPPLLFAYRWCLYQLKVKYFRKYALPVTVDGMKRSDSQIRKKLKPIDFMRLSKKITVRPLIDWTDEDVLEYLRSRGVPINPCYRLYGHSGGCMFCPYANTRHVIGTMSDPEWGRKISQALLSAREKMFKGKIGRSVYQRWMRWHGQTTISVLP